MARFVLKKRNKIQDSSDPNILRCELCSYATTTNRGLWKPANLGKQRRKPVVNRTGKKRMG